MKLATGNKEITLTVRISRLCLTGPVRHYLFFQGFVNRERAKSLILGL